MRGFVALSVLWAVLPLPHGRGSETRLTVPRAACLVDQAGQLYPLYGLPGGYVLGEPLHSGVLSAACGDGFTLVKTAEWLEWWDAHGQLARRWPAPGGRALIGVAEDGARAVVHFPATSEWFLVAGGDLRSLPVGLGGWDEEVLSVALLGHDGVAAAVRRFGRLWYVEATLDGFIREERELCEASAPILVREDGAIVWGAGEALVVQPRAGPQRHIPVPAPPATLEAAPERGIRVKLAGGQGHLMVRLFDEHEEIYRLPDVSQ